MLYLGKEDTVVFEPTSTGFRAYDIEHEPGDPDYYLEHLEYAQCTGLHDKNGNELYFDDIINIYFGKKKFGESEFNNGLVSELEHLVSLINLIHDNGASFEIIGNGFENPELLKEEVK